MLWILSATIGILKAAWKAIQADGRRFLVRVLRRGPVPRHIAFIMDGNRRYAESKRIARAEGHAAGFEKLIEVLSWCLELGVAEVTLYAFSIENFKRSKEEVDSLMQLALAKLTEAIEQDDWAARHGVTIRFIGDTTLLPPRVRETVARAARTFEAARSRIRSTTPPALLNLCFSYTSRDEISKAASDLCSAVRAGRIRPEDIDEELVERSLMLPGNPELLVRTSGEFRLSDFLLWQSSYSCWIVLQRLWPALRFRDLFVAVLEYQRNHSTVVRRRLDCCSNLDRDHPSSIHLGDRSDGLDSISQGSEPATSIGSRNRCESFIETLNRRRLQTLFSLDVQTPPVS